MPVGLCARVREREGARCPGESLPFLYSFAATAPAHTLARYLPREVTVLVQVVSGSVVRVD